MDQDVLTIPVHQNRSLARLVQVSCELPVQRPNHSGVLAHFANQSENASSRPVVMPERLSQVRRYCKRCSDVCTNPLTQWPMRTWLMPHRMSERNRAVTSMCTSHLLDLA